MATTLLLQFDAPLMSFGGPIVDNRGVIQDLPGLSMLTGLLANALGWDHSQARELNRLQERIRYAVRRDQPGARLRDFQTVDFSQATDDLRVARLVGWTTRGRQESRKGSADTIREKHIRYRDYLADSLYLVALRLDPADETPTVEDVERALMQPERPLFLGRKSCIPSERLFAGRADADSLLDCLLHHPLLRPAGGQRPTETTVWWEDGEETGPSLSVIEAVSDERDWTTQLHGGQRFLRRSTVRLGEVHDGAE
jgi:CRISPR system Cascade subunit CasD